MNWDKLIAELDERHEAYGEELVVTVLAIQVISPDGQFTFSGVGMYVHHTPEEVEVELGHTESVAWFGKKLKIRRENTKRAVIVRTEEIVLDALESANKLVSSLNCGE